MQVGFQAIPSSQRSSKQKLKEIDSRLLLHRHAEARIEHILIRQGSTETELIPPPLTSAHSASSPCAHSLSYSGGQGLDGPEM